MCLFKANFNFKRIFLEFSVIFDIKDDTSNPTSIVATPQTWGVDICFNTRHNMATQLDSN
jgi:hypothetical protein